MNTIGRCSESLLLILILVVATTGGSAQVRQASLIANIINQKGEAVSELPSGELSLLVGDEATPKVTFTNALHLPLLFGVLVDTSNSVRGQRNLGPLIKAVLNLMIDLVRPGKDAGLIADFDTGINASSGLTDDSKRWVQEVRHFRIGGGTALFDVIRNACTKQLRPNLANGTVRRVLIVITDGNDNQSSIRASEASIYAQQQNVIMYFLNPDDHSRVDKSWRNVSRMAEDSGGRAYLFSTEKEIAPAVAQIRADVAAQQLVVFDLSANATGMVPVKGQGRSGLQWHGPLSIHAEAVKK